MANPLQERNTSEIWLYDLKPKLLEELEFPFSMAEKTVRLSAQIFQKKVRNFILEEKLILGFEMFIRYQVEGWVGSCIEIYAEVHTEI